MKMTEAIATLTADGWTVVDRPGRYGMCTILAHGDTRAAVSRSSITFRRGMRILAVHSTLILTPQTVSMVAREIVAQ